MIMVKMIMIKIADKNLDFFFAIAHDPSFEVLFTLDRTYHRQMQKKNKQTNTNLQHSISSWHEKKGPPNKMKITVKNMELYFAFLTSKRNETKKKQRLFRHTHFIAFILFMNFHFSPQHIFCNSTNKWFKTNAYTYIQRGKKLRNTRDW